LFLLPISRTVTCIFAKLIYCLPLYTVFQVQISTRLWHKCGVNQRTTQKKPAPPLDNRRLRDLALHYAGRYSTTRAKLSIYLQKKIRDRGWKEGEPRADITIMVQEFADLGYVNDAAFADAKARSFVRRGFGAMRLEQELYAAGIDEGDAASAREETSSSTLASANAFARRKRIGPFAEIAASPELKRKQLAAFMRAGHGFDLARRFVEAAFGEEIS
jgi:regulatory protein